MQFFTTCLNRHYDTWHLGLLVLRFAVLRKGGRLSICLHISGPVDLDGRIGQDAEGCHVSLKIESFC